MVRNREEIEALIATYLKGEASPDQAMMLEDWKSIGVENQEFFDAIQKVFDLTHSEESFQQPDVNLAWKKIAGQLNKDPKTIPIWRNKFFYGSVAAAILILLVVTAVWKTKPPHENDLAHTNDNDTTTVQVQPNTILASEKIESFTLQDQSTVELQPGSKLVIAEDYGQNGRNVTLDGSGRFHVIHEETNPFIIHIDELDVVDIGTVFTVETVDDTVKVVVEEGAVELRLNSKTIEMAEGDSAFYLISQQMISRYKVPESRQNKVFEFNGTSLKEVASILGEFFNRKIVVMDESISNCPLSVTFKNESLPTILDIIKELLDVKIVQNQDIIGIYGEGCL